MLICEKCGIEYPSEIDFHQGVSGGQLICVQCPKPSGGQPEGEGAASEAAGDAVKAVARFSKGGIIAAAFFLVVGVIAVRDPDMGDIAFGYFGVALALGIRSFTGGMTWGRGILTALGGMCTGMVLIVLALADQVAAVIGPVVMTFAFLWFGFKRGPIQGGKKKR